MRRLTDKFGVTFDWRGFELIPPGMEYTPAPPQPVDSDAPPTPPSRFKLFAQAEGLVPPSPRPAFTRSHRALLGAEFARAQGGQRSLEIYLDAVYRGYWEDRDDIAEPSVLARYAVTARLEADAFTASWAGELYAENVVPYDDDAYAVDIRHVPTTIFNAEARLAKAGYADLARAMERYLVRIERFTKEG